MDPTTLDRLLEEAGVTCTSNGLTVTIHPSWIIEGEDRLSYTSLVRLVECCREHHWNIDILSNAESQPVDSITKSISGEFAHSILVGSVISISYRVIGIRRKGYELRFEVRDTLDGTLVATFNLVSVFYDSEERRAVPPPTSVFDYLVCQCIQLREEQGNNGFGFQS